MSDLTFGLKVIQESSESILLGFGESMLVLRVDKNPGTISHFMFGIDDYREDTLREHLSATSLDPAERGLAGTVILASRSITIGVGMI